jgi:hypothetical protein
LPSDEAVADGCFSLFIMAIVPHAHCQNTQSTYLWRRLIMTEIKPLCTELTDAEGANIQGGLAWFGNLVLTDPTGAGFISAYVDRTAGVSSLSVNVPGLRPILGFLGLTQLDFFSRL